MRIALALSLAIAACGSDKPPPPRPELIEVIRGLADQACQCETDKECLRAVRATYDAQKNELAANGLTGDDKARFDVERNRLKACGDGGGVTMWD